MKRKTGIKNAEKLDKTLKFSANNSERAEGLKNRDFLSG